jgi:hypothetical protein
MAPAIRVLVCPRGVEKNSSYLDRRRSSLFDVALKFLTMPDAAVSGLSRSMSRYGSSARHRAGAAGAATLLVGHMRGGFHAAQ